MLSKTERFHAPMLEVTSWLLGILLVAAATILASSGNAKAAIIVVAGTIGIFPLLNPSYALWFILVAGMVVTGLCQLYLPQFQELRWAVALLATMLGGIALFDYLFSGARDAARGLPPIFWLAVAFVLLTVLSCLVNHEGLNNFIFGFKGYFQVWGLLFALLMINWSDETIKRIPKFLTVIAFLQFPFVLHQYLYFVPRRIGLGEGIVAEDVVSGTFGASATGGGATAVLSQLVLITLAILISAYKKRLLSGWRLFIASIFLLLPIALNANKVALVFIAIMYIMLFGREFVHRPGKSLAVGLLVVLSIVGVFWSYHTMLSRGEADYDWDEFIVRAVMQNVAEDSGHGEDALNRWTVVTFWAREHTSGGEKLVHLLVGHGAGASREGEGGAVSVDTLASRNYAGMGIGLTAISAVLWELGVAGLALLIGFAWSAYRATGRLCRYYAGDNWEAATFEGLRFGVVIFVIGWAFQPMFVFHLSYQTLFLTVFGYIGLCEMRTRSRASDAGAVPTAIYTGGNLRAR